MAGLNLITPQAVDSALREFAKVGRAEFVMSYPLTSTRDYVVQDPVSKGWMDTHSVVCAAFQYRFPGPLALRPNDIYENEARVVRLLRELGYRVESRAEVEGHAASIDGEWSGVELELLVADYLEMLLLELAGQSYSRSARRRALVPLLKARTESEIDARRRNISACLIELGYPPIRSYPPATNKSAALLEMVALHSAELRPLDSLALAFIETPAVPPEPSAFERACVPAPVPRQKEVREHAEPLNRPVRRNYLEREARNGSLGFAGERFVYEYEQWRLAKAGCHELSARVRHVTADQGEGLGYDVLSFHTDGSERLIEVKTTAFGERTPFFVSATELIMSQRQSASFSLYRIYDFRAAPKFFELPGSIESHCFLDPNTYRAVLF